MWPNYHIVSVYNFTKHDQHLRVEIHPTAIHSVDSIRAFRRTRTEQVERFYDQMTAVQNTGVTVHHTPYWVEVSPRMVQAVALQATYSSGITSPCLAAAIAFLILCGVCKFSLPTFKFINHLVRT